MARTVSTSGSTSPKLPRFRSARGGGTLPLTALRRRGWVGRFAPPPDAGRAARDVAGAGRAVDRVVALRGAAVRRLAEDGAAGLRPADPADEDLVGVARLADAAADLPDDALDFRAGGFLAASRAVVSFDVAPLAAEPLAVEPFAAEPGCFFGATLPVGVGFEPFAFFASAAPAARGVDDGRAPGPGGRAGRREEGMGRLCRFARPLYRHYLRRAVNTKVRLDQAVRHAFHVKCMPNRLVETDFQDRPAQPWKRGNADRPA